MTAKANFFTVFISTMTYLHISFKENSSIARADLLEANLSFLLLQKGRPSARSLSGLASPHKKYHVTPQGHQHCTTECVTETNCEAGREPWSSGFVRRLMFEISWVWISAPYTVWTFGIFSHWFVVKNCIVCLKRGLGWPIKKCLTGSIARN